MKHMSKSAESTHSQAVEDYIKAIYKLCTEGGKATTKELADDLKLGQGTVSGMLGQLEKRGLVERKPYYGATLSEEGHKLAMSILRRHRLIELFLVRVLGYGWDEVDEDAERLEHAVSDLLIERIDAMLGHPRLDPHGDPIPTAKGEIDDHPAQRLSELSVGQEGVISRVIDEDPLFLQYLHELNVGLGSTIHVVQIDPFGTMQLDVGQQQVSLAREATERIFVSQK